MTLKQLGKEGEREKGTKGRSEREREGVKVRRRGIY